MEGIRGHGLERIKKLLETQENWPSSYTFKFIVPRAKLADLLSHFPHEKNLKTKESSQGKYISVTLEKIMETPQEVIDIYEDVSVVDGVISL